MTIDATATEPDEVEGVSGDAESPEPDDQALAVPESPVSAEDATSLAGEMAAAAGDAELATIPDRGEVETIAVMARILSGSVLAPAALKGRPADAFLVLLTGRDLGISITAAIRKVQVVEGQITVAPALLSALIRERGLGRIWPHEHNDHESQTWYATRSDEAHIDPQPVYSFTFTIDDAKRAKLVKDKGAYETYPQRMLSWRCRGFLIADTFPEAGYGIYSAEELGAFITEDGEVISVEAVEVPEGLEPPPPPDTDQPANTEAIAELVARIEALPDDALVELRGIWKQRDLPAPAKLTVGGLRRGVAMLPDFERRAERGEWGEPSEPEPEPERGALVAQLECGHRRDVGPDVNEDDEVRCPVCDGDRVVATIWDSADEIAAGERGERAEGDET